MPRKKYDMREDFEWFNSNRDEIINGHIGERVIIREKKILGYYKTDGEAIDAMGDAPIGSYIVHRCLEKNNEDHYYTGRYSFA